MSVYEQVKQALQDIVAPELKALQVEIKSLRSEMVSMKSELVSEIKRVDEKVSIEIRRLDEKLDTAIQIRERLAALEAKLASLEHG